MKLWTAATPNGWKVNIMIEELRDAGVELPEVEVRIDQSQQGEQFSGRVHGSQSEPEDSRSDRRRPEHHGELRDPAVPGREVPEPPAPPRVARPSGTCVQWVYWQAANVGPNFGNKLSYTRYMDDGRRRAAKAHPHRALQEGKPATDVASSVEAPGGPAVCVWREPDDCRHRACTPGYASWKWSKVITAIEYPNLMQWVDRVRARPAVERGLSWGMPKEEIDQWSEERKASYAKGGRSIASNDKLRTTL